MVLAAVSSLYSAGPVPVLAVADTAAVGPNGVESVPAAQSSFVENLYKDADVP